MWLPVTHGEELFQKTHEAIGARVRIKYNLSDSVDHMINPEGFTEFSRLVATIEMFLRCIRSIKLNYFPSIDPIALGRAINREEGVPPILYQNRAFCETAKQVGRIINECSRHAGIESDIFKNSRKQCYICGTGIVKDHGLRNSRTIEHIWPLSLGGETVEGNLLPACKDCNEKKDNGITWAWGPIQSTYHSGSDASPSASLRLSLGMARLMLEASGYNNGGRRITLKEAAHNIWPAVRDYDYQRDRPLVYFEMMQMAGG